MSNSTNHTTCAITPFQPPTHSAAIVVQLDTLSHSDTEWNTASALSKSTNTSSLNGLFLYGNETAKLVPRHITVDGFCWHTNDTQYKCFDDALKEHSLNATVSSWCFPAKTMEEPHKGEGVKGGVKGWVVFGMAVFAVMGGM